VIPFGFEPKTYSLEGCCSIQLSYGTEKKELACTSSLINPSRLLFYIVNFTTAFQLGNSLKVYSSVTFCENIPHAEHTNTCNICYRGTTDTRLGRGRPGQAAGKQTVLFALGISSNRKYFSFTIRCDNVQDFCAAQSRRFFRY
jgi:hypothetical protein